MSAQDGERRCRTDCLVGVTQQVARNPAATAYQLPQTVKTLFAAKLLPAGPPCQPQEAGKNVGFLPVMSKKSTSNANEMTE
jgi:hypothetical protein